MFTLKSVLFVAGSLCLSLVGCEQKSSTPKASIYSKCADADNAVVLSQSQCAVISAPLNYNKDDTETVSLFIRKIPTKQKRRGTVLLIAGGPGEAGSSYYSEIEFFQEAFEGFDLIIPDHRGTGYSSKLCEPEETKESEGGLNLVGEEWGTCIGKFYTETQRAHAFNMNNAAQDIATIVDTLDTKGDLFIYGVSYGTSLALATAERTDIEFTGIILDSLTPLPNDAQEDLSQRSQVTDMIGQEVLDRCVAHSDCPLKENGVKIYTDLLARIDAGEKVPGLDNVPNGDLRQLMGLLLDVPSARQQIPAIIQAMASNDEQAGNIISNAIQSYEEFMSPLLGFEQSASSIPLVSLMSKSEFNLRKDLTAEQVEKEKLQLSFTSPLPGYLVNNPFTSYEPQSIENIRIDLPPILLLHGTLDPKTSYRGAMKRVESFNENVKITTITLLDAPHAVYLTSQDCMREPLQKFVKDTSMVSDSECLSDGAKLAW